MSQKNNASVTCNLIRNYLDENRHVAADSAFREYLSTESRDMICEKESELRELLQRFYKKRKRDLSLLLDSCLSIMPKRTEQVFETQALTLPELSPPLCTAGEGDPKASSVPSDVAAFEAEVHNELRLLCDYHIFQWTTYYRDFVGRLFERLYALSDEIQQSAFLSSTTRQFSQHAAEIYGKGYNYVRKRASADALTKSLSGLQSFLSLPIEAYSTLAFNVSNAADAHRLRATCSAMLAGIIEGYGSVALGELGGWQLLPRFPRTWVHTFAFLTDEKANSIIDKIEEGELRTGLVTTALPVLTALDLLFNSQSGDDFCLPRLVQFAWDTRRLEISLSLPRVVAQTRYLELHCYLSPGFMQRGSLEESASRAATLIAGPIRPDLHDWAEAHDILRTTFVDTGDRDVSSVVRRVLDVLNHELAKHLGSSRRAEPITFNLARTFPLQNPFLARYFLVYRNSVRNLLRAFETDTGVRLWCSVRRSGKTTACFDLGASTANAWVVNQTMEHTEQYSDANIFSSAFSSALEVAKQLQPTFFRNTVRACVKDRDTDDRKLIFVLDEYETLFQRMQLAVNRDRELRYTVVQPLLNQMVGFSKHNLIIFIGQRPDSHYILMDQNQLSPYIKQDPFPLFHHEKACAATEFTELIRKVLTERVRFDLDFADALFAETAGHPYLTVNVLTDFFQWMIDEKRRAGELYLKRKDFQQFARVCLTEDRLRRSGEYDFFRNAIKSALSEETRYYDPWLFVVYRLLQAIAHENPNVLACSLERFDEIAEPLMASLGWDPAYLLSTATKANFFRVDKTVQPTIPILARLAGVSRPWQ